MMPKKTRPVSGLGPKENHMISLAVDLAEKKLKDGTANTPVLVHYLKLATTGAQLEKEKMQLEMDLLIAKKELLESQKKTEELYTNALSAMRAYSGKPDEQED
jgi:hypothetical protein